MAVLCCGLTGRATAIGPAAPTRLVFGNGSRRSRRSGFAMAIGGSTSCCAARLAGRPQEDPAAVRGRRAEPAGQAASPSRDGGASSETAAGPAAVPGLGHGFRFRRPFQRQAVPRIDARRCLHSGMVGHSCRSRHPGLVNSLKDDTDSLILNEAATTGLESFVGHAWTFWFRSSDSEWTWLVSAPSHSFWTVLKSR